MPVPNDNIQEKMVQKKKKKRRANKTGFPALKKKKRPAVNVEDIEKKNDSPSKRARKAKKTERNKKVHLPLRVSARIIAEQKVQSDTDSRPNSRMELTATNTSQKKQNSSSEEALSVLTDIGPPPIKRSKLYEDVDENIDCLALLPTNDMEIDDESGSTCTRQF